MKRKIIIFSLFFNLRFSPRFSDSVVNRKKQQQKEFIYFLIIICLVFLFFFQVKKIFCRGISFWPIYIYVYHFGLQETCQSTKNISTQIYSVLNSQINSIFK